MFFQLINYIIYIACSIHAPHYHYCCMMLWLTSPAISYITYNCVISLCRKSAGLPTCFCSWLALSCFFPLFSCSAFLLRLNCVHPQC